MAIARVRSWLGAPDGSVVAVSHGLVGRLIRGAYLGLGREAALVLPVPQMWSGTLSMAVSKR